MRIRGSGSGSGSKSKWYGSETLVIWICRGKELQPSPSLYSPFLHFFICQPSIDSLPSPFLCSPSISTLPSSYLPLLLSFLSSLYSSFPLNLSPSISTFPFPPNLSLPYFLSSLPISFPTCLLPYLSTFLPSPSLSFPLPNPSLFSAVTIFLSFSPSLFSNFIHPWRKPWVVLKMLQGVTENYVTNLTLSIKFGTKALFGTIIPYNLNVHVFSFNMIPTIR